MMEEPESPSQRKQNPYSLKGELFTYAPKLDAMEAPGRVGVHGRRVRSAEIKVSTAEKQNRSAFTRVCQSFAHALACTRSSAPGPWASGLHTLGKGRTRSVSARRNPIDLTVEE